MEIKIIDYGYHKIPDRKYYNDTGLDIYLKDDVFIQPYETITIDLGFGLELPDGYTAFLLPRSSMAKRGVITHMIPIDAGYRGEIKAVVTNHNEHQAIFERGNRICQLVVLPAVYVNLVTKFESKRGDGGFGSTGK